MIYFSFLQKTKVLVSGFGSNGSASTSCKFQYRRYPRSKSTMIFMIPQRRMRCRRYGKKRTYYIARRGYPSKIQSASISTGTKVFYRKNYPTLRRSIQGYSPLFLTKLIIYTATPSPKPQKFFLDGSIHRSQTNALSQHYLFQIYVRDQTNFS